MEYRKSSVSVKSEDASATSPKHPSVSDKVPFLTNYLASFCYLVQMPFLNNPSDWITSIVFQVGKQRLL